MKRNIMPMSWDDIVPGEIDGSPPLIEWVDPKTLFVDETYQRELRERSISLIRKIVRTWNWSHFKPPIVTGRAGSYEVIDGQHTAIAAASHPGVVKIPVLVVFAPMQSTRAGAFVGHNKDRLGITPLQLFAARLAAGDPCIVTINRLCEEVGANVPRYQKHPNQMKVGDCIAPTVLEAMLARSGERVVKTALSILVKSEAAPIQANQLRALEFLLTQPSYKEDVNEETLVQALLRVGQDLERQARIFAAGHKLQIWKAMAIVIFQNCRKARKTA